jgi:hypothetical protein
MIEFKVETILEDDCSWENLLVKTPDKDWHDAELTYGVGTESEVRNILRNISYCESVRKSFNGFLKSINEKFGQFERVENSFMSYDTPYGLSLDGVIVIASENFLKFEVGYETYESYGYWEPPSSDFKEYSKHNGFIPALRDALGLYMMDWFTKKQESDMEQAYKDNPEEYID